VPDKLGPSVDNISALCKSSGIKINDAHFATVKLFRVTMYRAAAKLNSSARSVQRATELNIYTRVGVGACEK
jgi:hypothetical protein